VGKGARCRAVPTSFIRATLVHGLVSPRTYSRVAEGTLPADWGGDVGEITGAFSE
jgi:hypothetical protein